MIHQLSKLKLNKRILFDILKRKKGMTLKLCRVLNMEYFYGKVMQKYAPKASRGPSFSFGK